jgi:hypothetical protein
MAKKTVKAPPLKGEWINSQKKVLGQARTACKGAKIKGKKGK